MSTVRIYTPDQTHLSVDALRKPLVFHLLVEEGKLLEFAQVVTIPTVMSVLGLDSAGSGPVGFVYLERNDRFMTTGPRGLPERKENIFIGAHRPGSAYSSSEMEAVTVSGPKYLGTQASAGILLSYFSFDVGYDSKNTSTELLEDSGMTVIPLVEYTVPDELLKLSDQAAKGNL